MRPPPPNGLPLKSKGASPLLMTPMSTEKPLLRKNVTIEATPTLDITPPGTPRQSRKERTFFQFMLVRLQRPEVVLIGLWWSILMVLVVYLADLGSVLISIGKPVMLLVAVPVAASVAICCIVR